MTDGDDVITELDSLRDIVARLPKTRDGVPVSGQDLWHHFHGKVSLLYVYCIPGRDQMWIYSCTDGKSQWNIDATECCAVESSIDATASRTDTHAGRKPQPPDPVLERYEIEDLLRRLRVHARHDVGCEIIRSGRARECTCGLSPLTNQLNRLYPGSCP